MKIVLADKEPESKCGGCNWNVATFYKLEGEPDKDGLCATCMIETLLDKELLEKVPKVCPTCGHTMALPDDHRCPTCGGYVEDC